MLEVTFALGILLLTLGMLLGSMVSISLAREVAEVREHAVFRAAGILEELRVLPYHELLALDPASLVQPDRREEVRLECRDGSGQALSLPLTPQPDRATPSKPLEIRVTLVRYTTRGHAVPVHVSALLGASS